MTQGALFGPLLMSIGGLVISYAAIQMLRGRQYIACVTGASVAMIPMLTPCYFLGIPIAIWALFILLKKETRTAFAEAN